MLIGLGKQVKKVVQQGPYTVGFSLYNEIYPATQTGDAPVISDKMAGDTFTIPTQGNLVRTEIRYQTPPGGGQVQQIPVNIPLHGWTDGNGLYFPGNTYTMPNSNITLTAIWQTRYSPSITDVQPYSVSVGDRITITGSGLGSVVSITFEMFVDADPSTIIVNSDSQISVIVPQDAESGTIDISTASGGFGYYYDAYEIV